MIGRRKAPDYDKGDYDKGATNQSLPPPARMLVSDLFMQYFVDNKINYYDALCISLELYGKLLKEMANRPAIKYEDKQALLRLARDWLFNAQHYNLDIKDLLVDRFNRDAINKQYK